MQFKLPYLVRYNSPRETPRYYVQKRLNKRLLKVRLRADPEKHAEFLKEYQESLARLGLKVAGKPTERHEPTDTLEAVANAYIKSAVFRKLEPASQRNRESCIRSAIAEPTVPGGTYLMKDCPIDDLSLKLFKVMRDRKAELPGAANNRVKYLKSMMAWALDAELIEDNPARDLKSVPKIPNSGYYVWTVEDLIRYLKRHPPGSKARLAMMIMLLTGFRRSDAVRLGQDHIFGEVIRFTPQKGMKTSKQLKTLTLPLLPPLREAMEPFLGNEPTFLLTEYGKPFSAAGFGNWMRDRCDEAELPDCTSHGLRKAGATIAANAGATTEMLKSMFGWTSSDMADLYVKAADQTRLAALGMPLLLTTSIPELSI